MPFIEWNEKFLTGFKVIDIQHKRLVDLTNQIYEAIKQNQAEHIIDQILNELYKYAHYHFTTEEKLMAEFDYPELDYHRKEHEKFIQKVNDFIKERNALEDKRDFTIEIMRFLKDWLIRHVLGTDMKYVPYLKAKLEKAKSSK